MSNKLRRISAIAILAIMLAIVVITIIAYGETNEEQLNIEYNSQVQIVEEIPEVIVIDTTTQCTPSLEKKIVKCFVNARKTPSTEDNTDTIIIPRGTSVDVLGTEDCWTRVFIDGVERYVGSEYLLTLEEWREYNEVPISDEVPLTPALQRYLWDECRDLGMKYCFALALIDQETGGTFRSDLISKTNDWGITQINKCNHSIYIDKGWITCSEDLLNPYNGIHCGLDFMNQYVKQYGCVERAYAQYNSGKPIHSNSNSRSFMQKYQKWINVLGDL